MTVIDVDLEDCIRHYEGQGLVYGWRTQDGVQLFGIQHGDLEYQTPIQRIHRVVINHGREVKKKEKKDGE